MGGPLHPNFGKKITKTIFITKGILKGLFQAEYQVCVSIVQGFVWQQARVQSDFFAPCQASGPFAP